LYKMYYFCKRQMRKRSLFIEKTNGLILNKPSTKTHGDSGI